MNTADTKLRFDLAQIHVRLGDLQRINGNVMCPGGITIFYKTLSHYCTLCKCEYRYDNLTHIFINKYNIKLAHHQHQTKYKS